LSDIEPRDDQLAAELAALFGRAEPVPDLVVATAKASFAMRSLDVELALLTWDSQVDHSTVLLRASGADGGPRALTFESDESAVEIEVAPPERGWRLLGQLTPVEPARVELHRAPGGGPEAVAQGVAEPVVSDVPVDELGRFTVADLPAGLVRIVVHREGRPPLATDWFRVD
jgi:hypothetical protein